MSHNQRGRRTPRPSPTDSLFTPLTSFARRYNPTTTEARFVNLGQRRRLNYTTMDGLPPTGRPGSTALGEQDSVATPNPTLPPITESGADAEGQDDFADEDYSGNEYRHPAILISDMIPAYKEYFRSDDRNNWLSDIIALNNDASKMALKEAGRAFAASQQLTVSDALYHTFYVDFAIAGMLAKQTNPRATTVVDVLGQQIQAMFHFSAPALTLKKIKAQKNSSASTSSLRTMGIKEAKQRRMSYGAVPRRQSQDSDDEDSDIPTFPSKTVPLVPTMTLPFAQAQPGMPLRVTMIQQETIAKFTGKDSSKMGKFLKTLKG